MSVADTAVDAAHAVVCCWRTSRRIGAAPLAVLAAAYCLTGSAPAAADAPGALDEITVTARKRAENILDVPVSITAISADTIERAGIADFMDYALKVPNLTFGYADGQGVVNSRSIAIRGVQGLSTTGFYLNDVPLPDGVNPFTLDLARVEVLRGPQGTLYGARSMGGTVRLITESPDPKEFFGSIHQSFSSLHDSAVGYSNGYQTDLSLNIPIGSTAAVRMTGFSLIDPGWLERRFTDAAAPGGNDSVRPVATKYEYGATVSLLWNATESITIKPMLLYQSSSSNGMPLGDVSPGNNVQQRLFNVSEGVYDEWTDASLVANWKSAAGELTAVTSYFYRNASEREDVSEWLAGLLAYSPALSTAVRSVYPFHEFVEEIRFASNDFGPVRFTGGVYYANIANNYRNPPWLLDGLSTVDDGAYGTNLVYTTIQNSQVRDQAVFGELTYKPADHWSAIAGLRYSRTDDRYTRNADGVLNGGPSINLGSSSESKVTPKFTLDYEPTTAQNYYLTAAEGFRPGAPNFALPSLCAGDLAALGLTLADTTTYKADHIWSYELGAKTRLPGGRLSINGDVYWINWSAIQQSRFLPTCAFSFIGNAGAARSRGAELEVSAAPLSGWSLTLGVGYTDAKITESGPSIAAQVGDPIQQIAPWTVSFSSEYTRPVAANLEGTVRLDYSYVDHSLSATNDQFNPRLRPGYEIANLRLGLARQPWDSWLFVNNLGNTRPNLADDISTGGELPGRRRIVTSAPRTFGVEARWRF